MQNTKNVKKQPSRPLGFFLGSTVAKPNSRNAFRNQTGFSNNYGIVFGGNAPPDPIDVVEVWNGSSWTEIADIATARKNMSGAGSGVAALCIGGENPGGNLANVEEWTNPFETKTIGTD